MLIFVSGFLILEAFYSVKIRYDGEKDKLKKGSLWKRTSDFEKIIYVILVGVFLYFLIVFLMMPVIGGLLNEVGGGNIIFANDFYVIYNSLLTNLGKTLTNYINFYVDESLVLLFLAPIVTITVLRFMFGYFDKNKNVDFAMTILLVFLSVSIMDIITLPVSLIKGIKFGGTGDGLIIFIFSILIVLATVYILLIQWKRYRKLPNIYYSIFFSFAVYLFLFIYLLSPFYFGQLPTLGSPQVSVNNTHLSGYSNPASAYEPTYFSSVINNTNITYMLTFTSPNYLILKEYGIFNKTNLTNKTIPTNSNFTCSSNFQCVSYCYYNFNFSHNNSCSNGHGHYIIITPDMQNKTGFVEVYNKVNISRNISNLINISWYGGLGYGGSQDICNSTDCNYILTIRSNNTKNIILDSLFLGMPNGQEYNSINVSVVNGYCSPNHNGNVLVGEGCSSYYDNRSSNS